MPDQFGGWDSNFLLDGGQQNPGVPVADLGGWDSNFLLDSEGPPPSVPFVATPSGGSPPPQISVPFANQPSKHDPLIEILQGRGGQDWKVPKMDPASTFQPRTDTLTADGIPFPKHFWPGSDVFNSSSHERRRLQYNKDAAFPHSHQDWDFYGGSLKDGRVYEPPKYDGTVPLARLMKPLANDTMRGIKYARDLDDDKILNGLMGGNAVDLADLGMDEEFKQKLQVYRNYKNDADNRGNKESAAIAAKRKKEIVGKAREIWNKALDNQERFERLKQVWREELDSGQGFMTGQLKDSARERIAGQALMDVGTLAGSMFYRVAGREATADDLNLTKLAYDSVIDEYAGGSQVEAGLRGAGSSLFQGLLFARLGTGIAGPGASGAGAQVATAVGFGQSARDQAMAEASMTPMTDRSRKRYAGRQAAIEAGVMGAFGVIGHAVGAQTLESILGGGQKIQSIRKGFATLLGELTEESLNTGLQDFNGKSSGVTPEDTPLLPQLIQTWAQTALTVGLAEGSRRAVNFASKLMPTRQDAITAGVDVVARTAPARQQLAETVRQAEAAMRKQVDKVGGAAGNLWEMAEQALAPKPKPEQPLAQDPVASQPVPAETAPPAVATSPLDDLAARHPEVAEALAGPTGTPEFNSIREHTAAVLDRYQKSGASTGIPELDAVMPSIIALHDIGKPAAIAAGDKNRQHEMTLPMLERVMRADGATDQQVAFGKAIVGQDIIGQLLKGQISVGAAHKEIADVANSVGMTPQQFLPIAQSLYSADAGSYAGLSKLFDSQGRIPNYDLRSLEESVHGEVQSIPWSESYRGGGGQSPSPGDVQRAIYSHSSAVDFTRFDAAKDSGTNLAGPGAYLLPAGNDRVAKIYQDRAIAKGLKALQRNDRMRIMQAIAKKDLASFDKWIAYAQERQKLDPTRASDWGQVADVLASVRDNGAKGVTLEFEFEPKKMLDLGSMTSGGRVLSPAEIKALEKAGGNLFRTMKFKGEGPLRGWDMMNALQKAHGYAGANALIRKAGFDSIGFIHTGHASQGRTRHPVVVALDHSAPVRVQSGQKQGYKVKPDPVQHATGIPVDKDTVSAIRRMFLSGGNQDSTTRNLVYRRDSIIRKHNAKVQRATGDLRQAVTKHAKQTGQKISDDELNEALADPAKMAQLPTDVAVEVAKIRDHIDLLSDQIQMLGGVTPDMFMVIEGNKGKYITRSFRKFDNPKAWRNFAIKDPTIMADFAAEVRQHSPQATDQEIESLAEQLLRNHTITPGAIIQSGSTTQNYVKILKRRKDLSPAVRQLYGENTNLFENYANTVGQMSSMVAHRGFIENLVKDGLAAGIFSQAGGQRAQPDHVQEVAHQAIPQLAGMKGILMEPELAQAIDDLYAMAGTTQAGRLFASGSGLVKANKTIFALPRAMIRNLTSNIPMTIANGNWRIMRDWSGPLGGFKDMGSALRDTFMHDLLNQGSQAAKDAMERLKELGVVESFRIEELKDAARASSANVNRFITGKGKFAKVVGGASRVYAAMDTVSKIQNYRAELDTLQRAFPNAPLHSLEERAARIVRATNPTYGEASKAAKWWSRHAPLGSFAMFSAEILRTTGNRNLQMIEELTSGNKVLMTQGLRRLVGQGVAYAGIQAVAEQLAAAFGMELDDDEMQALLDRIAPWQKNSHILVTSKDENGKPTSYIDLGYNDPFGIITKTARAAYNGNQEDVMRQLSEPFLSEDILAGTILSLWRGRDERDRPIYSEGLSEEEQWKQAAQFAAKKVEPGVVSSGRRLWDAWQGKTTSSGIPLVFANELASNFGGARVETFDRETADYYANRKFDDQVKASQTAIRQAFLNKGTFDPDYVRRIYQDAEDTRRQTLAEWRKYVDGSKLLGEENPYGKVVRDVGQESQIVKQMYSGTFIPYRFSDEDFGKMLKLPQGEERIKLFQELYRKSVGMD